MAIDASGAAAIGAGGDIVGSLISSVGSYESMKQQESFQKSMSDTAYQRAVASMKAAGLNPMLAAGGPGPASTPSGASYTIDNPFKGGAATAVQIAQADATTSNLQKQGDLLESQKNKTDADAGLSSISMASALKDSEKKDAEIENVKANTLQTYINAAKLSGVDTDLVRQVILRTMADTANTAAQTQGTLADNARRIATAKAYQAAPIVGWLEPFIDMIAKAAKIAAPIPVP